MSHDHHDHAGHDHARHDHAGHDHAGHADHDHGAGGHSHAPPENPGRAFAVGVLLNISFVIVGVIAGFAAHSTALLADAAHNMGDVVGLAMAWGAMVLAKRARTRRRTYGLRRTTIVATLANAMLILFAIGGVTWEAVQRLGAQRDVDGVTVAIVAAIGVVLNGVSALLFARGRHGDLNMRGAFLHLVADAAVSAGVVVAGLVVWQTGASWVDPVTSIAVSAVILYGTIKLLREALNLLLDAVPDHIDPAAVERYLGTLPGVCGVHDLHIWSMSTTEVALTAHLVVPWHTCSPTLLGDACAQLNARFKIAHATIQLEPLGAEPCERTSDAVV